MKYDLNFDGARIVAVSDRGWAYQQKRWAELVDWEKAYAASPINYRVATERGLQVSFEHGADQAYCIETSTFLGGVLARTDGE